MFKRLSGRKEIVLLGFLGCLFILFTIFTSGTKFLSHVYKAGHPGQVYVNKQPAEGLPVLMYHSISDAQGNPLCVPIHRFRQQMHYLHDHEFHTVSLRQLESYLISDESLPSKPVLITFDDGNADTAKVAYPIMREYGFTGTLFVIGQAVDKDGMVSSEDLRTLSVAGWDIGNHTFTHAHLPELPSDRQIEELGKTEQVLLQILDQKHSRYFSYPIGAYDERSIDTLKKSGITLAFTTEPGWVKPNNNPYKIPRFNIGNKTSMPTFIYKVTKPFYNSTE
jgi:peptidoglycan/xylan/chitin deacetylase (PgdA/CDA1 family)